MDTRKSVYENFLFTHIITPDVPFFKFEKEETQNKIFSDYIQQLLQLRTVDESWRKLLTNIVNLLSVYNAKEVFNPETLTPLMANRNLTTNYDIKKTS